VATLDPDIIVAEIDKGAGETIRVTLSAFRGTPTVGIWRYYRDASGQLQPGKGGLVLGIRHLPAVASAFALAVDAARATGRLPME
jgi:Transcriptional Coactivator p15 (PC4)